MNVCVWHACMHACMHACIAHLLAYGNYDLVVLFFWNKSLY
nr:hypothetical protein GJFDDEIJ_00079 [Oryctes rhinoceros nudivirus]